MEYKYFYHSLQRQKPSERYNALYSSDVFSYTDGFYLQKYNADNDPNKTFFWDYMDSDFQLLDELKAISILEKVKREPFQNKELEKWFLIGGREAIMNHMGADEIYSCSMEDLVRAGIISDKDYLEYLYKKYENQQRPLR